MNPGFSCSTCVYFSQYRPSGFDRPMTRGQCRRHAPVLYQTEEGERKAGWPMVHEEAWCGEHAQIAVEESLVAEQRPQPSVAEVEVMIAAPKPVYDGPGWRCVNCQHVEDSPTEPERCFVCRCHQFARVEA